MKTEKHFYDSEGKEVSPDKAIRAEVLTLSDAGSVLKIEYFNREETKLQKLSRELKYGANQ